VLVHHEVCWGAAHYVLAIDSSPLDAMWLIPSRKLIKLRLHHQELLLLGQFFALRLVRIYLLPCIL